MGNINWSDAIIAISEKIKSRTPEQLKLAQNINLEIENDLPFLVAAARIRATLWVDLCLPQPKPATENQINYLQSFGIKRKKLPSFLTQDEVRAWIAYSWLTARKKALQELKLMAGDIVSIKNKESDNLYEVSSISDDGHVYFKGGAVKAWADTLEIKCRHNENSISAEKIRYKAINFAGIRMTDSKWSVSKRKKIQKYAIEPSFDEIDVERLREVIENAKDEKPIQIFLSENRNVFGALLRGKENFCIPHPQLGSEYVPDFLIADTDSSGIRWIAVELETPNSTISLKDGSDFDKYCRKGISQINQWREWLKDNIAYARSYKKEKGFGLVGINPDCDALVLVGRRSKAYQDANIIRNQRWEKERIMIRTYDGLLEQLENLLVRTHPWATAPFILKPFISEDR